MTLFEGKIIQFQRVFKRKDVELFTKVSKDKGKHHTNPDELGRFVVQGLLTATLPTKVGGDFNVLARTMHFEFLRPVFTEDIITCEVIIDKLQPKKDDRLTIETSFKCTNQTGKLVVTGSFAGVILTEE